MTQAQEKALAEEMKAVFIETSAKENQVSLIHNSVSSIRYTYIFVCSKLLRKSEFEGQESMPCLIVPF